MTNAQIIMMQSVALMEQGLLKGTGRKITVKLLNADGEEYTKEMDEPEEIHTFAGWKALGYNVRKGEKSGIRFSIWKYSEKAKKPEEMTGNPIEDLPKTSMFMKDACWFTAAQVEPLKA